MTLFIMAPWAVKLILPNPLWNCVLAAKIRLLRKIITIVIADLEERQDDVIFLPIDFRIPSLTDMTPRDLKDGKVKRFATFTE